VENNPDSNIVVVKTEIHQPGTKPVTINYSMHVSGGEWKVVDVTVDGISLVATYRGSFASEIRKSGMDALIAKLTERNTTATNVATQ
jgi:phospholipid transport system substrate-binding protein